MHEESGRREAPSCPARAVLYTLLRHGRGQEQPDAQELLRRRLAQALGRDGEGSGEVA